LNKAHNKKNFKNRAFCSMGTKRKSSSPLGAEGGSNVERPPRVKSSPRLPKRFSHRNPNGKILDKTFSEGEQAATDVLQARRKEKKRPGFLRVDSLKCASLHAGKAILRKSLAKNSNGQENGNLCVLFSKNPNPRRGKRGKTGAIKTGMEMDAHKGNAWH